ncbi:MAG: NAD(P)H-hydrate dehydratase [Candidatus Diapherotrites archaeon]
MNTSLKMRILDSNLKYFGVNISEIMENAGKGIAKEIETEFGKKKKIAVFSGLGNNGGDGFVAARYLASGNNVSVYLIGSRANIKTLESKMNFALLSKVDDLKFYEIKTKDDISKINTDKFDIVVDALFGIGVSGKLAEPYASVVDLLNKSKAKRVAVDIPTPGFESDFTISLHIAKAKASKVIDIGIPKDFTYQAGPGHVKFLKRREEKSHKGENGIVLIIAGSKQYHGAAIFAGLVASKLVDLVYFATPKENIPYIKKASPEFIVNDIKDAKKMIGEVNSILIGPGLEKSDVIKKLVDSFIKESSPENKNKKLVLDATALRVLDKKLLHENCVLTPHADEFSSLFKEPPTMASTKKMASKYNCIIILKGAVDFISDGKEIYKNFSGNPGMTTGGTGDILAGLVVAFASRNSNMHSAIAGAFLNGYTADILKKEKGMMYNAEDILKKLPEAKLICDQNF